MKPGQNTWLEYQADRAALILAGKDTETNTTWLYEATGSDLGTSVVKMCRTLIRQRQVEEVTQRLKS